MRMKTRTILSKDHHICSLLLLFSMMWKKRGRVDGDWWTPASCLYTNQAHRITTTLFFLLFSSLFPAIVCCCYCCYRTNTMNWSTVRVIASQFYFSFSRHCCNTMRDEYRSPKATTWWHGRWCLYCCCCFCFWDCWWRGAIVLYRGIKV